MILTILIWKKRTFFVRFPPILTNTFRTGARQTAFFVSSSYQQVACSRLSDGGKEEKSRGRRGDWGPSLPRSTFHRGFSFSAFPLSESLEQANQQASNVKADFPKPQALSNEALWKTTVDMNVGVLNM